MKFWKLRSALLISLRQFPFNKTWLAIWVTGGKHGYASREDPLQLLLNIYWPQRSCGQGNIFTPVCHSVHRGGLPQCMLGYTPPTRPLTPGADPRDQTPPQEQTPPTPSFDQTPSARSRLQHTVYERPVRILLECILVYSWLLRQKLQ